MLFNSVIFALFLPIVFGLHYLRRGRRWQNSVLLIASYIFYGYWDYRFCALLLGTSLLDYWTGHRIAESSNPTRRKFFLAISLIGNLGVLGFYKYFNFFADSFALLLATAGIDINTSTLNYILPVGISFYTFQTLSYSIDIYRREFEPRRDLIQYLTFVSFFPQLVAGPIERARDLLPQFSNARVFSPADAIDGCRLMLWGFLKKMVFADNLAVIANAAFAAPGASTDAELFVGAICFSFQIYGDFSGYSDIATGVAKLFGIELRRNFAYPYFSQSLSEFWRRWHISLSTWFRDYVFIPLGGSRGPLSATAANILLTMTISGLWHGAAWHFVMWGVFHGLLVGASRMLWPNMRTPGPADMPAKNVTLGTIFRIARTFAFVCIGWIFFRAATLTDALTICARLGKGIFSAPFYTELAGVIQHHWAGLAVLIIFGGIEWLGRAHWNPLPIARWPAPARWMAYTALTWAVILFGTQHVAEFIYFQF
jgi:alginate O-acetyltransferase complex protein AlgI